MLAPGVDRTDVGDDIAGFTRLSPALKKIVGQMKDSVYWIYVSSESGVHISYPGHGGYPSDYDPRRRPWYNRAKKYGALTWGPPIVDATTRQLDNVHVALLVEINAEGRVELTGFGLFQGGLQYRKWVAQGGGPSLNLEE